MNLPENFEVCLRRQKLISSGDKVFVACSGGPDSVGLLHLLLSLKDKWRLKIGLLHFNHAIRGRESDADEHFVKSLAKKFSISVYTGRGRVMAWAKKHRTSLEEAAHDLRYQFLIKTAKKHGIPKIAFAHTQEDQAETVLMRILQGTGIRGLSGIRSHIAIEKVHLVRPLLEFSKADILKYLRENKIRFRRDRSNRSTRFVRNRIRMKLLPWLAKEFNPRVVDALARIPSIVKAENEMIEEMAQKAWKRVLKQRRRKCIYLDRNLFLKFPSSLQFRVVERAVKSLDEKGGVNFDAWERLRNTFSQNRSRMSLPRDLELCMSPRKLTIYKKST